MNIAKVSVHHPVRVAMLLIVLLVFGLVALVDMNTEFMSDISLPTIEVLTYYPGSGAKEVERDITDILEKEFITLPNFSSISSSSTNFVSWITITFKDGVDPYDMLEEVRYRVKNLKEQLPTNLRNDPVAVVGDASMLPVFTFTIQGSKDIDELTQFVEETIVPNITRIKGVAEVNVTGGTKKEVRITLRTKDLYTQKISAIEVMQAIQNSNVLLPLQSTTYHDNQAVLQFDGRVTSIDSLNEIVVGVNTLGSLVTLKDVGDVAIGLKDNEVYVDGTKESALLVNVTKRKDGNTISIAKEIRTLLQGPLFSSPSPYRHEVINDDSSTVSASLFTVIRSGLFGIIMAVFVMLFFLSDIRATLTIALSVPLSILFTLIGMRLLNISINLMSLSGMVIALGMVVDASIVMLEHIIKEVDENVANGGMRELDVIIIEGAKVVTSPIFASTTTTIAVFVPLSLLTGIIGSILRDVSLTLILSLSASFLVAVIVVPFILHIVLQREKRILHFLSFFSRFISSLSRGYQKGLSWALSHRLFILIIAISALIASIFAIGLLGITFIPSTDTGEFYIDITYKEGTTVEETRRKSLQALELVKQEVKENTSITLVSGSSSGYGFSSPNEANMRVILTPVSNRSRSVFTIIKRVQEILSQRMVGAQIRVTNGGFDKLVGFVSDGGGYAITLEGEDIALLYDTAVELENILAKDKSVLSTSIDTAYDSSTLSLLMSQHLMASLGISSMESGITSKILFSETEVGELKDSLNNVYPIYLESDIGQEPFTSSTLLNAKIITSDKREVAFASIGELLRQQSVNRINHKERVNTITLSATLVSEDTKEVNQTMNDYLATHPLPTGVNTSSGGLIELIRDSIQPMITALLVAIFLVYTVMVLQFEFFKQPLIVMASIPFTLIGVILGLLIFNSSISLLSFMAIIALSGMVVNNGILLIESINIKMKASKALSDNEQEKKRIIKAISEASASRLRPILMTTLTTMLGVIPMAVAKGEASSLYAPLGQAIVGGLVSSTLLTLFIIPILYEMNEMSNLKKRMRERGKKNE
ncbi:MAG: efflux RND transporter permease subunit [Spirochaetia bacterium]|nr:efflux RND transporter permease subunit [Spirochaetia bacterium]